MQLINPFPISQKPYSSNEIQLADFSGENLPDLIQANAPLELVEILTEEISDHRLSSVFHEFLNNSKEYQDAKTLMPYLKDVPNIKDYRDKNLGFNSAIVDEEIRKCGVILTTGQVLYHGGIWPRCNHAPNSGDKFELTRIFSTTLCPQVAAVHACNHKPHCIWIITVDASPKTPVFVFNNKGQNLGHEAEVLFSTGATVTCESIKERNNFTIIEATIS